MSEFSSEVAAYLSFIFWSMAIWVFGWSLAVVPPVEALSRYLLMPEFLFIAVPLLLLSVVLVYLGFLTHTRRHELFKAIGDVS